MLDPDGNALPSVQVMPSRGSGGASPAETTEAGTGAFERGPYPRAAIALVPRQAYLPLAVAGL